MTSDVRPDIYSLKLDGRSTKAYAKRGFDTASGNLKFSVNVYSKTANNMKVSLGADGAEAIAINIKDGKISCGGVKAEFVKGIWNKLTIETDSDSKTAKLFVNYREAEGEIPYMAGTINEVCVETAGAKINASLTNADVPEGVSAAVIIALYKDGRLMEVKITPASRLVSGGTVTTEAITVPDDISDGDYKVSAFVWDNINGNMLPVCKKVTVAE